MMRKVVVCAEDRVFSVHSNNNNCILLLNSTFKFYSQILLSNSTFKAARRSPLRTRINIYIKPP